MEIPAEFRGLVYKFKTIDLKHDSEILNEIKKDFPDSDIGILFEVRKNLTMDYILAIEFEREEDYTAFILKYGGRGV